MISYSSGLTAGNGSRGPFWSIPDLFGAFRTFLECPLKAECANSAGRARTVAEHPAESPGKMVGMAETELLVNLLDQSSRAQEQKRVAQLLPIQPLLGRRVKVIQEKLAELMARGSGSGSQQRDAVVRRFGALLPLRERDRIHAAGHVRQ